MTRYAAENFSLRQEIRQLISLESVVKAEEAATTVAAELDEAFQRAMETESLTESKKIMEKMSRKCTIAGICVHIHKPMLLLLLQILSQYLQRRS